MNVADGDPHIIYWKCSTGGFLRTKRKTNAMCHATESATRAATSILPKINPILLSTCLMCNLPFDKFQLKIKRFLKQQFVLLKQIYRKKSSFEKAAKIRDLMRSV